MTITEIANFERKVENYINDNLTYVAEYNDNPTAQDLIEHFDTNGAEGVGEELTDEQRAEFLIVATRVLGEVKAEADFQE